MYAALLGYESLAKILIEAKSNIEISNKRGFTALMLAKFNGFSNIYDILVKLNAKFDMSDKLRFNNFVLEQGREYSCMDIIKKEIYCDNREAKRLVSNIFSNIEKYGDFRIELIMTCIALHTLEKNKTGNNFQIFVTNHIDISVFNGEKTEGVCMIGLYNASRNFIQISSFGGEFIATKTFIHELVHKIHLSCENLYMDDLERAAKIVDEKLEELPKSIGSRYIRNNLIQRINNYSYYSTDSSKLMEYLADSISYIIIYQKHQNDEITKDMKYILKSIYDVFDVEISKTLKEYILRNKNFDKIKLSNSMKESLCEFKNDLIDGASRKYKLQQIPSNNQEEYTWDYGI